MKTSSKHIDHSSRVLVKVGFEYAKRVLDGVPNEVKVAVNKIYIVNNLPKIEGYSARGCVVYYGRMGRELRKHTYLNDSPWEILGKKSEEGSRGSEQKYEHIRDQKEFTCPGCSGPVHKLTERINSGVHVCIDCGQHIDSKDDFALAVAQASSGD